jgi:hypothetical protein
VGKAKIASVTSTLTLSQVVTFNKAHLRDALNLLAISQNVAVVITKPRRKIRVISAKNTHELEDILNTIEYDFTLNLVVVNDCECIVVVKPI